MCGSESFLIIDFYSGVWSRSIHSEVPHILCPLDSGELGVSVEFGSNDLIDYWISMFTVAIDADSLMAPD